MALKNSATGERTQDDLLLQNVPGGLVAFRAVLNDPPTEEDFKSHYELGLHPDPTRHYKAYAWFGVSFFLDDAKAERLVETARKRGDSAWLAKITFESDLGLYGTFNEKTTHLEVFGFPHVLLELADS